MSELITTLKVSLCIAGIIFAWIMIYSFISSFVEIIKSKKKINKNIDFGKTYFDKNFEEYIEPTRMPRKEWLEYVSKKTKK